MRIIFVELKAMKEKERKDQSLQKGLPFQISDIMKIVKRKFNIFCSLTIFFFVTLFMIFYGIKFVAEGLYRLIGIASLEIH